MKKTLIAVAVIVATATIAPKVVSTKVEESLTNIVSQINNMPGYKAEIKDHQYGWFNSSAQIMIGIDLNAMSDAVKDDLEGKFSVPIDFSASHGPILTGDHAGLGWVNWTASYSGEDTRKIFKWDDSEPLYRVTSNMGLLGSTSIADRAVPFTAPDDVQTHTLNFSGYEGKGTYSAGVYSYSGEMGKFEVDTEGLDFSSEGLSVEMELKGNMLDAIAGELFDTTAKIMLNKLNFEAKQEDLAFNLQGIKVGTVQTVDKAKGLANIVVDYNVAEVDSMGFVSTDLAMVAEVKNLSVDFLKAYQKFVNSIGQLPPEDIQMKSMEFATQNLLTLLAPSPEFNITDLHGTIPQGKFNATAFSKVVGIDTLPANIMDPGFWLGHLAASAEVKADKAVVELIASLQLRDQLLLNPDVAAMSPEEIDQIVAQQTPAMLSNFQQQGLLIETEEGYQTNFTLKDGAATINDTPIPLPGL